MHQYFIVISTIFSKGVQKTQSHIWWVLPGHWGFLQGLKRKTRAEDFVNTRLVSQAVQLDTSNTKDSIQVQNTHTKFGVQDFLNCEAD